jgi:hypothetical protein
MRLLLLFIAFAVCTLPGCKKDKPVTPSGLFGKWELSRRFGGNILPADTVFKPGNGNILQLNSDSTYKRYTNGQLSGTGNYHVRSRSGYQTTQVPGSEIFFDNDHSFVSFITVSGNVLTLQPILGDIASTQYQKIQN